MAKKSGSDMGGLVLVGLAILAFLGLKGKEEVPPPTLVPTESTFSDLRASYK